VVDRKLLERAGGWHDFLAIATRLRYWPPPSVLNVVKTTKQIGPWPKETKGKVIEADTQDAQVQINDDRGKALDLIRVPLTQLALPERNLDQE
jgi:hypothetical protein